MLHVCISGYNSHVNVTDENSGHLRPYFFALPVTNCYANYLNITSGIGGPQTGGTWDYEVENKPRELENQLEFRLFLNNVPYTPAADYELYLELSFEP